MSWWIHEHRYHHRPRLGHLLAPFTSDQRDEQRQMVEVNLLGAMTATEVFLDQLRDGGGDLINISSGIRQLGLVAERDDVLG